MKVPYHIRNEKQKSLSFINGQRKFKASVHVRPAQWSSSLIKGEGEGSQVFF